MNREARQFAPDDGRGPQLQMARQILRQEGEAVLALAGQLSDEFCRAVDLLVACRGSVMVTGIGKAGLIGQKIAATLASTGTRSHFLHPAEAIHGDLGRLHRDDLLLVLSHSGETEEIVRILPSIRQLHVPIVAITGQRPSQLARHASVTLSIGAIQEAGPLRLAPSTSTTAMLALGDALALVASQQRGFSREDFARCHPGGSLGRQLARVEDVMRPRSDCRVANQLQTVRQVLISLGRPGRRCGAILLVDGEEVLAGIFTDSDLARILERQQEAALDRPICEVMTRSPTVVEQGTMMTSAVETLVQYKISELPVVDRQQRPIGVVDITDVVGLLPHEAVMRPLSSANDAEEDFDPAGTERPTILPLPHLRERSV